MDQLEKEAIAAKLMMGERMGSHMSITVGEVLQLRFRRNGVALKHFAQQSISFLSDYENFASFIGACFLLTRSSSSASSALLSKGSRGFFNSKSIEKSMPCDDHVEPWRIIVSAGLPKIATPNLDLNLHPWINPLWSGLQDALPEFDSKLLMKRWNAHRGKSRTCIDDGKFHLSISKACDAIKSSRHLQDNANGLTNHALAISGLGF